MPSESACSAGGFSCVVASKSTPTPHCHSKADKVSPEHEENPLHIQKLAVNLPGHTYSVKSIATIRKWLNECEATHTECQHQDDNKLRTDHAKRFLKFSGRLIALVENVQVDCYACSSHCWGISNKPVMTTTNNIEKHMTEIPWEQSLHAAPWTSPTSGLIRSIQFNSI